MRQLALVSACMLLPVLAFAFIAVGTSSGPRSQVYANWLGIIALGVVTAIAAFRFWRPIKFGPLDWVLALFVIAPFAVLVAFIVYSIFANMIFLGRK